MKIIKAKILVTIYNKDYEEIYSSLQPTHKAALKYLVDKCQTETDRCIIRFDELNNRWGEYYEYDPKIQSLVFFRNSDNPDPREWPPIIKKGDNQ